MQIRIQTQIAVARPLEQVFDFAVACESFPRVLLPFGPLPGVVSAEMQGGADPKPGALRRIGLSDGSSVVEEISSFDRPARHRYRWATPPAPPLGWLVRAAEGDWAFAASEGGTRIRWSYRFELTTALALPLALPIVGLFRLWMSRGLARVREALEGGQAPG